MEIVSIGSLDIEKIRREVNEIIDLAIQEVEEILRQKKIAQDNAHQSKQKETNREEVSGCSSATDDGNVDNRRSILGVKFKELLGRISWIGEDGHFGGLQKTKADERFGEQLNFYPSGRYPDEGWPCEDEVYSTFLPKEDPMDGSFNLEWCFGVNKGTSVIPLTEYNIFYSSSHLGVIYNYEEQTMRALVGHTNRISCVAEGGKYLVTADEGINTPVLILWDKLNFQPLRLWTQPPPGILLLAISEFGDYLFTVSASQPHLVKRIEVDEGIIVKGELPSELKLPVHLSIITVDSSSCVVTFPQRIFIIECEKGELKHRQGTKVISNNRLGKFRRSCSVIRDAKILTGTSKGQVVVWSAQGKYEKAVQLIKEDITWLQLCGDNVVIAFEDGTIGLYGQDLRLKTWFVQSLGSAKSVHLSRGARTSNLEFTMFTSKGNVASISRNGDVHCILKGSGALLSMDCSPNAPFVVVGDEFGQILLYDVNTKSCELIRTVKSGLGITALSYGPDGDILLAGLQTGELLQLDPISMKIIAEFMPAKAGILKICFSQNKKYFSYLYEGLGVGLYKHLLGWNFKGKYIGHYKNVTGMTFGDFHLYTVGEDRRLVKYDVRRGLKLVNVTVLEQLAYPTSIIWYSGILIIPNSETKVRMVDAESREIIRTIQGPEQCPITAMKIKDYNLIYAAGQFIGEFNLLDYQWNALTTAHPSKVSDLCICDDMVCTIGNTNSVLLLWSTKETRGLPPKELPRFIDETIRHIFEQGPIQQIKLIDNLRLLGFFPSDFEANNILRENVSEEIDEDTFRMIYQNFLPVKGILLQDLHRALLHVCELTRTPQPVVVVQRLMDALRTCEEPMTNNDVLKCLNILIEPSLLTPTIPIDIFITDVLGVSTALI